MTKTGIFSDRKRTLIFINVLIVCIASTMLMTAMATALPTMAEDLGVDTTTIQWVTSGYTLAMGIMYPLTAFLITRFQTKPLFLTGIFIFIAGLIVCIFAPNFPLLMVGRVLQACACGLLTSMGQVIILTIFPAELKGTAMGWYGLAAAGAPVIAPTISGILVDLAGWRSVFVLLLIIVIVCLLIAIATFGNILPTEQIGLDIFSVITSVIAFGGLTLGVGNAGSYAFVSAQVLLPILIGGIFLLIFIRRQLRMDKPFLDLRTWQNRDFTLSIISSMILFMIFMGTTVITPLYVQQIKGLSATISGLVTLPGSLTVAVVSLFAGKIYDKIGIRRLYIIASLFLIAGNAVMYFVTIDQSVWVVAVINVVRCVASGCLTMTLVTWGVSVLKPELTAHATVQINAFRTIAGAVGSAVFVGIMTMVSENSAAVYGETAAMHGFNMVYLIMAFESIAMFLIPVFFIKEKK